MKRRLRKGIQNTKYDERVIIEHSATFLDQEDQSRVWYDEGRIVHRGSLMTGYADRIETTNDTAASMTRS